MTALTNAQKQALFRERKKAEGLVRVMVWVPAARADDIREAARQMLDKADDP